MQTQAPVPDIHNTRLTVGMRVFIRRRDGRRHSAQVMDIIRYSFMDRVRVLVHWKEGNLIRGKRLDIKDIEKENEGVEVDELSVSRMEDHAFAMGNQHRTETIEISNVEGIGNTLPIAGHTTITTEDKVVQCTVETGSVGVQVSMKRRRGNAKQKKGFDETTAVMTMNHVTENESDEMKKFVSKSGKVSAASSQGDTSAHTVQEPDKQRAVQQHSYSTEKAGALPGAPLSDTHPQKEITVGVTELPIEKERCEEVTSKKQLQANEDVTSRGVDISAHTPQKSAEQCSVQKQSSDKASALPGAPSSDALAHRQEDVTELPIDKERRGENQTKKQIQAKEAVTSQVPDIDIHVQSPGEVTAELMTRIDDIIETEQEQSQSYTTSGTVNDSGDTGTATESLLSSDCGIDHAIQCMAAQIRAGHSKGDVVKPRHKKESSHMAADSKEIVEKDNTFPITDEIQKGRHTDSKGSLDSSILPASSKQQVASKGKKKNHLTTPSRQLKDFEIHFPRGTNAELLEIFDDVSSDGSSGTGESLWTGETMLVNDRQNDDVDIEKWLEDIPECTSYSSLTRLEESHPSEAAIHKRFSKMVTDYKVCIEKLKILKRRSRKQKKPIQRKAFRAAIGCNGTKFRNEFITNLKFYYLNLPRNFKNERIVTYICEVPLPCANTTSKSTKKLDENDFLHDLNAITITDGQVITIHRIKTESSGGQNLLENHMFRFDGILSLREKNGERRESIESIHSDNESEQCTLKLHEKDAAVESNPMVSVYQRTFKSFVNQYFKNIYAKDCKKIVCFILHPAQEVDIPSFMQSVADDVLAQTNLLNSEILRKLEESSSNPSDFMHVEVSCSYYEIYQSKVFDLVSSLKKVGKKRQTKTGHRKRIHNKYQTAVEVKRPVPMRPSRFEAAIIPMVAQVDVSRTSDVTELLLNGNKKRVVASLLRGLKCPRSHALFDIKMKMAPNDKKLKLAKKYIGKITVVDLASNIRGLTLWASSTPAAGAGHVREAQGNERMIRQQEEAAINKAILALRECLAHVSRERSHIAFRQNILTQILADVLAADCSKSCLVGFVSGSHEVVDTTLDTLRFADRIKEMGNAVYRYPLFGKKLPATPRGLTRPASAVPSATSNELKRQEQFSTIIKSASNMLVNQQHRGTRLIHRSRRKSLHN